MSSSFKFDLDQTVFYMKSNRIHSAPVLTRMKIENAREDFVAKGHSMLQAFGPTTEKYSTIHGIFSSNELFSSKEQLIEHLLKNEL